MFRQQITVSTRGRGTYDISAQIRVLVREYLAELGSTQKNGLCHLFLQHTSASLIISENADPDVRNDLETFFADLVVDGDTRFRHRDEGPDDMSAHLRSVLTQTELIVPFSASGLELGTWQGIYLWEHRTSPHQRRVFVTLWI